MLVIVEIETGVKVGPKLLWAALHHRHPLYLVTASFFLRSISLRGPRGCTHGTRRIEAEKKKGCEGGGG